MEPKFTIQINDGEELNFADFIKSPLLPENINSIKLDFNTGNNEETGSVSIIPYLMLIETLVDKVKNPTEYTVLLSSLINSMLVIKKLEADAGLGDYRY